MTQIVYQRNVIISKSLVREDHSFELNKKVVKLSPLVTPGSEERGQTKEIL